MAYCKHCNTDNPEVNKFCANCGMALVGDSTPLQEDSNTKIAEGSEKNEKSHKKIRSAKWMIVGIIAIAFAIVGWVVDSFVGTIIMASVGLGLGIISLIMRAKFRAISIVAIVISGILLAGCIIFGSYEYIYNKYSNQLKEEYTVIESELRAEIASGKSINEFADSYSDKGRRLTEIAREGVAEMANRVRKLPTTSTDYLKWSKKLEDEYLKYVRNLRDIYQEGANSIVKNYMNDYKESINELLKYQFGQ